MFDVVSIQTARTVGRFFSRNEADEFAAAQNFLYGDVDPVTVVKFGNLSARLELALRENA